MAWRRHSHPWALAAISLLSCAPNCGAISALLSRARAADTPDDDLTRQPQSVFLDCITSSAEQEKGARFRQCVVASQEQCIPGRVRPVCAWYAGFGSSINTWVHSFAYALEHGLTWIPTGPWPYADPVRCPAADTGSECYFKKVTQCPTPPVTPLNKTCAQWYNRHNASTMVIKSAEIMGMSRDWVWGQMAAFIMQMLPEVSRQVEELIPNELQSAGATASLQIRVGGKETGEDGIRQNLGITPYLDYMKKISAANNVRPQKIYIMSDDANLTAEALNQKYSGEYEFVRPHRRSVDLRVTLDYNGSSSKADIMYDLLADIWASVRSDVFIGTASNLFWLVYALKQARPEGPGVACWINTVMMDDVGKLLCPGDPGFYTYSPKGLRPSLDEEFLARRREGESDAVALANAKKIYSRIKPTHWVDKSDQHIIES